MSKRPQTIFRHTGTGNLTVLNNSMIRDNSLSFEARGMLAFILSLPANWQFHPSWLLKEAGIGKDRLYRILKDLINAGYCERRQERGEAGQFSQQEYVFHGQKLDDQPRPANPDAGHSYPGIEDTTNRDLDKEIEKQKATESPRPTTVGASGDVASGGAEKIESDRPVVRELALLLNPKAPNPDQAERVLTALTAYSDRVIRDAVAQVRVEIATGKDIKSPAALLPSVCQRLDRERRQRSANPYASHGQSRF